MPVITVSPSQVAQSEPVERPGRRTLSVDPNTFLPVDEHTPSVQSQTIEPYNPVVSLGAGLWTGVNNAAREVGRLGTAAGNQVRSWLDMPPVQPQTPSSVLSGPWLHNAGPEQNRAFDERYTGDPFAQAGRAVGEAGLETLAGGKTRTRRAASAAGLAALAPAETFSDRLRNAATAGGASLGVDLGVGAYRGLRNRVSTRNVGPQTDPWSNAPPNRAAPNSYADLQQRQVQSGGAPLADDYGRVRRVADQDAAAGTRQVGDSNLEGVGEQARENFRSRRVTPAYETAKAMPEASAPLPPKPFWDEVISAVNQMDPVLDPRIRQRVLQSLDRAGLVNGQPVTYQQIEDASQILQKATGADREGKYIRDIIKAMREGSDTAGAQVGVTNPFVTTGARDLAQQLIRTTNENQVIKFLTDRTNTDDVAEFLLSKQAPPLHVQRAIEMMRDASPESLEPLQTAITYRIAELMGDPRVLNPTEAKTLAIKLLDLIEDSNTGAKLEQIMPEGFITQMREELIPRLRGFTEGANLQALLSSVYARVPAGPVRGIVRLWGGKPGGQTLTEPLERALPMSQRPVLSGRTLPNVGYQGYEAFEEESKLPNASYRAWRDTGRNKTR